MKRYFIAFLAFLALSLLWSSAVSAGTYSVLKSFSYLEGEPAWPEYGPVAVLNNKIYGVTGWGGDMSVNEWGMGTLYEMGFDGVVTVKHSFTGATDDGEWPNRGVILKDNTLYGTTQYGGEYDQGTVFKYDLGTNTYSLVYSFSQGRGDHSTLAINNAGDTLYGVDGYSAYKLNVSGGDYTTLFSFPVDPLEPEGNDPVAGLTLLNDGYLYGVSYRGGGPSTAGTVFKIPESGGQPTILYKFNWLLDNFDAANPVSRLEYYGGYLYGMAEDGGTWQEGAVFRIRPDGSGYTVLYSFNTADGSTPQGSLAIYDNVIYGTTMGGGSNSQGVLFSMGLNGGNYQVLQNYSSATTGNAPLADLVYYNGNLLGTTLYGGGPDDAGVFFKYELNEPPADVPEPSTLLLLLPLAAFWIWRKRKA